MEWNSALLLGIGILIVAADSFLRHKKVDERLDESHDLTGEVLIELAAQVNTQGEDIDGLTKRINGLEEGLAESARLALILGQRVVALEKHVDPPSSEIIFGGEKVAGPPPESLHDYNTPKKSEEDS